jgi:hypothetical protein
MTRIHSTLTWGIALIVAALVLNWQQSIAWSLGAAGGVATIGAIIAAIAQEDTTHKAKVAKDRTHPTPSAFLDSHSDAF